MTKTQELMLLALAVGGLWGFVVGMGIGHALAALR